MREIPFEEVMDEEIVFHFGKISEKRKQEINLHNNQYTHFGVDDDWIYSSDETVLLKKIHCFRDIEALSAVDVYIFYYGKAVYILHTISKGEDDIIIEYILNAYGRSPLNENIICVMERAMERYLSELFGENNKYSKFRKFQAVLLTKQVQSSKNPLDMNIYSDSDPDMIVKNKYGIIK